MAAVEDVNLSVVQMVDAINRVDMTAARTWFVDDAIIVEDIAPYRWDGPGAVDRWLETLAGSAERLGAGAITMALGDPTRIDLQAGQAYALYPGCLTVRTASGQGQADGTLALTLTTQDGRWMIETLVWSGANPQIDV